MATSEENINKEIDKTQRKLKDCFIISQNLSSEIFL